MGTGRNKRDPRGATWRARNHTAYFTETLRAMGLEEVGAVFRPGARYRGRRPQLYLQPQLLEAAAELAQAYERALRCAFLGPTGARHVAALRRLPSLHWGLLYFLLRACRQVATYGLIEHTGDMYTTMLRKQDFAEALAGAEAAAFSESAALATLARDGYFTLCDSRAESACGLAAPAPPVGKDL